MPTELESDARVAGYNFTMYYLRSVQMNEVYTYAKLLRIAKAIHDTFQWACVCLPDKFTNECALYVMRKRQPHQNAPEEYLILRSERDELLQFVNGFVAALEQES